MERIAHLSPPQRRHEATAATGKAVCRLYKILRRYSSLESSKPGARSRLLIPIRVRYEEADVEKLLYRKNGKKVKLVVLGNVPRHDAMADEWRSKHDDVERLCSKVGIPFLSGPNAEKLRECAGLDEEEDACSICGVIVGVNVPCVWDDFETLYQEIADARMLKSFVQELELTSSSSNPALDVIRSTPTPVASSTKPARDSRSTPTPDASAKPALELPLKSRRRPNDNEESTQGKPSVTPRAATCDDAKSNGVGQYRTEADARRPISESHVQHEESVRLPVVGEVNDVGSASLESIGSLHVGDDGDFGDTRLRIMPTSDKSHDTAVVSLLLGGEVEEEKTDFKRQMSDVPPSQTYITKEEPVYRGQVGEHPVVTESSLDAGSRLCSASSDSCVTSSADECNRTLTYQITGLEVEALLFESNIESLSSLQLAIDLEIERSLGRLVTSERFRGVHSFSISRRVRTGGESTRFDPSNAG